MLYHLILILIFNQESEIDDHVVLLYWLKIILYDYGIVRFDEQTHLLENVVGKIDLKTDFILIYQNFFEQKIWKLHQHIWLLIVRENWLLHSNDRYRLSFMIYV